MDKCLNLSVIPQFGGTCWFNAILMIALYSQNVRKVVLKVANKWDKSNSFLMIIKSILVKYYNEPEKVQSFFKKIKPEIILFKMLNKYNQFSVIKHIKDKLYNDKSNLGWFEIFIIKFFKLLHVNCLDIIYLNGKYYLNFDEEITYNFDDFTKKTLINKTHLYESYSKKKERVTKTIKNIIKKIPDIIIVSHEKINFFVEDVYKRNINSDEEVLFNANRYKCKIKGIDTYDDIIYVNGYKYKLDACTLTNYNYYHGGNHAIAGITCNDKRYVYNGWQSDTTDPAFTNYGNYINNSPCSLMCFDWDLKRDIEFCLNLQNCKLDKLRYQVTDNELCFSFGKDNNIGRRFLIYVREKSINTTNLEKGLSIPEEINISNLSTIIKDIHDIKQLDIFTLRQKLQEFGIHLIDGYPYSRESLESLLYNALEQHYNITPQIIQEYKKKEIIPNIKDVKKIETKNDLIKQVLEKYPKLKNLNSKTKTELKEILKGKYDFNKEKPKDIPRHKTKEELMSYILHKIPKLNKTQLEKIIQCTIKEISN